MYAQQLPISFDLICRYREAKTKFIFEPNDGVMYLEQKLPISWHAFNETPKYDVSELYFYYSFIQRAGEFSLTTVCSYYVYLTN